MQLLLLITLTSLFAVSSSANAHGGGLDGNGGHNCYVGSCAGTYHYHRNYSYRPIIPYAPMAYCINHEDGYTISELKYLQFEKDLRQKTIEIEVFFRETFARSHHFLNFLLLNLFFKSSSNFIGPSLL